MRPSNTLIGVRFNVVYPLSDYIDERKCIYTVLIFRNARQYIGRIQWNMTPDPCNEPASALVALAHHTSRVLTPNYIMPVKRQPGSPLTAQRLI